MAEVCLLQFGTQDSRCLRLKGLEANEVCWSSYDMSALMALEGKHEIVIRQDGHSICVYRRDIEEGGPW